jgi:hypothetical protein
VVQAARLGAFSHQGASDGPLAPGLGIRGVITQAPAQVAGLGNVTQIAAGFQFGLAIG